jgi:hypothetical protein
MSLSRSLVVALALVTVGCGSTPASQDASNTDASQNADANMMMSDAGGMMMVEAGAGADAGSSGTCGDTTKACLCACGMNAQCQNQCITTNMACNTCVGRAQIGCCPTEAAAVQSCSVAAQMASDAGPACMDTACIAMRCTSQVQALQTCFNTAQTGNPSCQAMLGGCFGSYPLMCN